MTRGHDRKMPQNPVHRVDRSVREPRLFCAFALLRKSRRLGHGVIGIGLTIVLAERLFTLINPAAVRTVVLGAIVLATNPGRAAEQRCPPRLPGLHAGFTQSGPIPAAHWLLWRMRLFDWGADKNPRPEFAPDKIIKRHDGFTSTWNFTLDEDLMMVCLYRGSGTYYFARRQAPPGRCVMDDENGLTRAWCE